MRHFLLILAVAALVGCGGGKKNLVEKTIRKELAKSEGGLTKADFEKVTSLSLRSNQLTDVKGLEKLTQLTRLYLVGNPDLTKAQIDQLQKALPKCKIDNNAK